MSHTIIIRTKSASAPGAAIETSESGIEAEVTYTPDHNLTPAQTGSEVAKILRKLKKLCDPVETGE